MKGTTLYLYKHGPLTFGFVEVGKPLTISQLSEAYRRAKGADAVFGKVELRTIESPDHPEEQFLAVLPNGRHIPRNVFEAFVRGLLPSGEVEVEWKTRIDDLHVITALVVREILKSY